MTDLSTFHSVKIHFLEAAQYVNEFHGSFQMYMQVDQNFA